jgi:hypothetical protein
MGIPALVIGPCAKAAAKAIAGQRLEVARDLLVKFVGKGNTSIVKDNFRSSFLNYEGGKMGFLTQAELIDQMMMMRELMPKISVLSKNELISRDVVVSRMEVTFQDKVIKQYGALHFDEMGKVDVRMKWAEKTEFEAFVSNAKKAVGSEDLFLSSKDRYLSS